MSPVKLPSATFLQIVKSPQVYTMLIAMSMLGYFVSAAAGSDNDRYEASQTELKQVRAEKQIVEQKLEAKDKQNYDLMMSLLVNGAVIKELRSNIQSKDSLKTAKEIKP